MAQFKYRKGFQFPVDPEIAGVELETLKNKNGGTLTADVVVDEAKDPTNPLHKCFEWDDTIAANMHRKQQARILITSIVVTGDDGIERKEYYNVTVRVENKDEKKYVDVYQATDDIYKEETIEKAKSYLETFIKKFEVFGYLDDKIEEVKNILNNF
jgi:hypothetical protein